MRNINDQIYDLGYLSLGGLVERDDCILVESSCYKSTINRILESELFVTRIKSKKGCGAIYFYSVLVGDL